MRKTLMAISLVAAAGTVAACGGGSTVDNQSKEQTSVAPLSKASKASTESSAASSGTASASATASADSSRSGGAAAAPAPKDEPVKEVSAVPSKAPSRSAKEEKYLARLKDQGIKVDGIEEQMIGAASQVCQNNKNDYVLGAIAGQVVTQQRSDKKAEEVADVIAKSAKDNYC